MDWRAKCAAMLCGVMGIACGAVAATANFGKEPASADARYVAQWSLDSGDSAGRHFLIVDKKEARLFVFQPGGALLASTPVLLGATQGDFTVPGVGERAQSRQVGADERTTPAGRFETQPGRNLSGEHVVWLDYASALAIHRLRPGASHERRAFRLASRTPEDNRISLGCVVVPVAFYQKVIEPLLGSVRGVVYVLPETQPVRAVFNNL